MMTVGMMTMGIMTMGMMTIKITMACLKYNNGDDDNGDYNGCLKDNNGDDDNGKIKITSFHS